MNDLLDELLLEIFIRLPDSRSAIRCGCVCQRWFSLISNPQFVPDFTDHHQDSPLPYAFWLDTNNQFCSSKAKKLLDAEYMLSFLSDTKVLLVLASCNDLLLVTNHELQFSERNYLVCNPFTKQWTHIPETPCGGHCSFSLVCGPDRLVYKVVCFLAPDIVPEDVFRVMIFSSDTREWTESTVLSSPPVTDTLTLIPVGGVMASDDGTLHWLDHGTGRPVRSLVSLNPFSGGDDGQMQCRCVDLPTVPWPDCNLHIRAFGGRLRVVSLNSGSLRIYELGDDSLTWYLKHGVQLWRHSLATLQVLGMNPNDDNVLFLLSGCSVLRYDIRKQNKFRIVDKFPVEIQSFLEDVSVFRLELPSWPTRL